MKLGVSQFLKANQIPASRCQFVRFLLRFLKVEAAFPFRGNVFLYKSYIRVVETDFLSKENCFLIRAIFLLVETITGIRRKQFSKRKLILGSRQLISRLMETFFFSIFQGLLLFFFSSIEKVLCNEILHLLVETDIRARFPQVGK